jgi:hypothetical protein
MTKFIEQGARTKTSTIEYNGNKLLLMPYIDKKKDQIKLINDNKDWFMEWFTILKDVTLNKLVSQSNTAYMHVDESKCKMLSKHTTEKAFLVRVDIPHRVLNIGHKPRLCISIRFLNNNFERLATILS